MSDSEPGAVRRTLRFAPFRVLLWLFVAGIGGFLFVTGIIGILVKAQ